MSKAHEPAATTAARAATSNAPGESPQNARLARGFGDGLTPWPGAGPFWALSSQGGYPRGGSLPLVAGCPRIAGRPLPDGAGCRPVGGGDCPASAIAGSPRCRFGPSLVPGGQNWGSPRGPARERACHEGSVISLPSSQGVGPFPVRRILRDSRNGPSSSLPSP
jgi:hypothetical protein